MTATAVFERIEVSGVVQGVGFRPFVYRLAQSLDLDGHVGNDSSQVFIDIAGTRQVIDEFVTRLRAEVPPLACIDDIVRRPSEPFEVDGFSIVESREARGPRTLIAPDTAVCDQCLHELFDRADRRYRHPFITCTNCGPRFTIIRALPYDRPSTTMAGFTMCPACAGEYADPGDRRHHAQPIGCHDCGPVLSFRNVGHAGSRDGEAALAAAVAALGAGLTVAVKGLGGFHLVADATNDQAVSELRHRKRRPDKPFAVMVRDPDVVEQLAHVTGYEHALLCSPARPVVLLRRRLDAHVSSVVAPDNPLLGVMLPYTPLHHLLLHEFDGPLIMTSANHAGEPIVHRNRDVDDRLGKLCDVVLEHDRPIHLPCDDSVVRVVDGEVLPLRRARGFAPIPVRFDAPERRVLAVGGEMKNAFCVTSVDHAWVGQHIGDMGNLATLEAFASGVDHFRSLYEIDPDVVAIDSHPGYSSSRWARSNTTAPIVEVQHHHAHVAAVMAEHRLPAHERVIGFTFDGTGYGPDGTIWGGEVLMADADGFERVRHLAPVPLPGGDEAIANPYRVALAHLRAAEVAWSDELAPVRELDTVERRVLDHQLDTGFACVPTSSMGRLFDAVASLLGLRHRITYEAQAAIDLEISATDGVDGPDYRFDVYGRQISPASVIGAIVADLRVGVSIADIARGFHLAVADLVATLARQIRFEHGLDTVVLSGGVFQNALLTELCLDRLRAAGFAPLTHRIVPPNDGGLALGQAYIAAHRFATFPPIGEG